MKRIAVVGAGVAGLQTVLALREQGYSGRITLIGAEPHRPYDRPPLSKDVLLGRIDVTTFDVDWDVLAVDERLGCRVVALRDGELDTDAGPVGYDRLVIATGARPVPPPGSGTPGESDPAGVYYLHTLDDALALRAALVPGAQVAVVGAGWIGAEAATAAAAAGCRVTVVEAADVPLAGALPAQIGAATAPWYEAAGIELRTSSPVTAVESGCVRLADGEELAADVVIVGVGVRPETGWLAGSGIRTDDRGAILVDHRLRTSLPGVYAVGDCIAFESRRYGGHLHVEHWANAMQSPRVAVTDLMGGTADYDPAPYFWSEQFGRRLQYVGHHPAADELLWRGDPAGSLPWSACWLCGDRLVALLAVDRPRDIVQGRKLIEQAVPVDRARLADPAVQLRDCTAGAGA